MRQVAAVLPSPQANRSQGREPAILRAQEPIWYAETMVAKFLREVMEQAETWPEEDQAELAEYAREIQAQRTGVYPMAGDERATVHRGLSQADRGKFVSDEVVAEADRRQDL